MTRKSELNDGTSIATISGLANLARMIYHGVDHEPLVSALVSQTSTNPRDAGALMDLSMIVQLTGDRDQGLVIQAAALELNRVYRCVHGTGAGLRVLALFAPGDFMANTPFDFLLDHSDATVYYAYTSAGMPLPNVIPDHDVAFLGVAESDANNTLLGELAVATKAWPRTVINRHADRIADMTRDRLWESFQDSPNVLAPRNARATRAELLRVADGTMPLSTLLPNDLFPIIVRPVDSHAGNGLGKIDDVSALGIYLAAGDDDVFYIAPFVDYSSPDGRFRKYRIVFISGCPYIAHLAISDAWMVHYLNAGMHDDAAKREEEAACMTSFDEGFGARNHAAMKTVATQICLDYFAIDCAELRDGRLLLFEAGTGMIVHAMDSGDVFPYKQVQMKKIFTAFQNMLEAAARKQVLADPQITA